MADAVVRLAFPPMRGSVPCLLPAIALPECGHRLRSLMRVYWVIPIVVLLLWALAVMIGREAGRSKWWRWSRWQITAFGVTVAVLTFVVIYVVQVLLLGAV